MRERGEDCDIHLLGNYAETDIVTDCTVTANGKTYHCDPQVPPYYSEGQGWIAAVPCGEDIFSGSNRTFNATFTVNGSLTPTLVYTVPDYIDKTVLMEYGQGSTTITGDYTGTAPVTDFMVRIYYEGESEWSLEPFSLEGTGTFEVNCPAVPDNGYLQVMIVADTKQGSSVSYERKFPLAFPPQVQFGDYYGEGKPQIGGDTMVVSWPTVGEEWLDYVNVMFNVNHVRCEVIEKVHGQVQDTATLQLPKMLEEGDEISGFLNWGSLYCTTISHTMHDYTADITFNEGHPEAGNDHVQGVIANIEAGADYDVYTQITNLGSQDGHADSISIDPSTGAFDWYNWLYKPSEEYVAYTLQAGDTIEYYIVKDGFVGDTRRVTVLPQYDIPAPKTREAHANDVIVGGETSQTDTVIYCAVNEDKPLYTTPELDGQWNINLAEALQVGDSIDVWQVVGEHYESEHYTQAITD